MHNCIFSFNKVSGFVLSCLRAQSHFQLELSFLKAWPFFQLQQNADFKPFGQLKRVNPDAECIYHFLILLNTCLADDNIPLKHITCSKELYCIRLLQKKGSVQNFQRLICNHSSS